MTSFVGKWKLLLLVFFGCCAFAKAELPKSTAHTIFSSTEIATFSIDKNTTRSEIFELFKRLFLKHSIKAKLKDYKRHDDVIILLDLILTDQNGVSFPLKLENEIGIHPACIIINEEQNNILEFTACDTAIVEVSPVYTNQVKSDENATVGQQMKPKEISTNNFNSQSAAQEVIAARKEKTETQIETAKLRIQQQKEERKLDILDRKAVLEQQQSQVRIRNEKIAEQRAQKREQQLEEVRERQLAKREELEVARITKLEEEKRQIAIETARFEEQAKAERTLLDQLEKQRVEAQEREDERRLQEEEAKQEALILKEEEKEREREVKRVRKRLEEERLEEVRVEKERVKLEKQKLEDKRLEREIELEKLSQARMEAQAALDNQLEKERKEAAYRYQLEQERKEKELIDERERYRGETVISSRRELMLNANEEIRSNETTLEQGFLIFNAEQCSYKVFPRRTVIYDALGNIIITINQELLDAPQSGKVTIKGVEATFEFTSNLLIIKNSLGEMINEDGKAIGAGVSTIKKKEPDFIESARFEIKPEFTKDEVIFLLDKLSTYKFDAELLELEHSQNNMISYLSFRIGDESYLFKEKDSIPSIIIRLNEESRLVKVSQLD